MNSESRILRKRLGLARRKKIVLLICTGDICRNPMTAGYLRKLAEERGIKDLDVRTAGTMTVNGLLATDESVQLLEECGVDLKKHRSRPLVEEMIRRAHLVLGMTPIHVQTTLRMCAEAADKTYLLRDYAGTAEGKNSQINDPMGNTLEVYKNCFKLIKQACEGLLRQPMFDEMATKNPDGTPKRSRRGALKKTAAKSKTKTAKSSAKKSTTESKTKKTKAKTAAPKKSETQKTATKSAAKKSTAKAAPKRANATVKKSAAKKTEAKAKPAAKKKTTAKKPATKKTKKK